jgi:hypothetical protein
LLESLEFDCQITDSNGVIVLESNSAGGAFRRPGARNASTDKSILLLLFQPFEQGNYTLMFTVTQGAQKLKGLEQQIVSKYLLWVRNVARLVLFLFVNCIFSIGNNHHNYRINRQTKEKKENSNGSKRIIKLNHMIKSLSIC